MEVEDNGELYMKDDVIKLKVSPESSLLYSYPYDRDEKI
jgi:hypothetical protein